LRELAYGATGELTELSNQLNEESWDKLSLCYQELNVISVNNYHYNPYGPGEKQLGIIGTVEGLEVLDVGCGGGQNAIALMKWGAKSVTGVDQSSSQLDHAKRLAEKEHVPVTFIKADIEDMLILSDNSYDLTVSTSAMNYVSSIERVFKECARVLKPNGRLVTCMAHPLWLVLGEALEYRDFTRLANYFEVNREKRDWNRQNGERIATFESTPWQLSQMVNGLVSAGFNIERIEEPRGYSEDDIATIDPDAMPYHDSKWINRDFIRANRIIPNSIIVSARKNQ
jgi:ubiquinone/menaquinone biosynthesis C-methylase UbiE